MERQEASSKAAGERAIQSIPLDQIRLGGRQRVLKEGAVEELAASIREVGLLQPITVVEAEGGYRLVAGWHRREACRRLGWRAIPAEVLDLDDLDAELAELDENLWRAELTVLERAEHLARRDAILRAKGERAPGHRRRKDDTASPFATTADLAAAAGVSKRTVQRDLQLVRELPEPIRDLLRGTPFADKSWELQELARIRDPEVQADVVRLLVEQGFETVEQARRALERRYEPCEACGVVLNGNAVKVRGVWHCQGCGDHPSEDEPVCGRCGARRDESPLPVQQEAVGALDDRAREATDPLAEETRRRREQAARDQATRDAFYDAAERLRWQDPVEVVRAVRRLNDDEGMDRVRLEAGKGLEWFARLDVEAWGGRAH